MSRHARLWTVGGSGSSSERTPAEATGGLNKNIAALFQLGACDPLAPPPPRRRRPYRSDGRLPSVRFCAITPAIAALL